MSLTGGSRGLRGGSWKSLKRKSGEDQVEVEAEGWWMSGLREGEGKWNGQGATYSS